MAITSEVAENMLSIAVKMAEIRTGERDEATLGEIAQKLGELGEIKLMADLNAHRQRFQTALNLTG